jgi:hypothetical protein
MARRPFYFVQGLRLAPPSKGGSDNLDINPWCQSSYPLIEKPGWLKVLEI